MQCYANGSFSKLEWVSQELREKCGALFIQAHISEYQRALNESKRNYRISKLLIPNILSTEQCKNLQKYKSTVKECDKSWVEGTDWEVMLHSYTSRMFLCEKQNAGKTVMGMVPYQFLSDIYIKRGGNQTKSHVTNVLRDTLMYYCNLGNEVAKLYEPYAEKARCYYSRGELRKFMTVMHWSGMYSDVLRYCVDMMSVGFHLMSKLEIEESVYYPAIQGNIGDNSPFQRLFTKDHQLFYNMEKWRDELISGRKDGWHKDTNSEFYQEITKYDDERQQMTACSDFANIHIGIIEKHAKGNILINKIEDVIRDRRSISVQEKSLLQEMIQEVENLNTCLIKEDVQIEKLWRGIQYPEVGVLERSIYNIKNKLAKVDVDYGNPNAHGRGGNVERMPTTSYSSVNSTLGNREGGSPMMYMPGQPDKIMKRGVYVNHLGHCTAPPLADVPNLHLTRVPNRRFAPSAPKSVVYQRNTMPKVLATPICSGADKEFEQYMLSSAIQSLQSNAYIGCIDLEDYLSLNQKKDALRTQKSRAELLLSQAYENFSSPKGYVPIGVTPRDAVQSSTNSAVGKNSSNATSDSRERIMRLYGEILELCRKNVIEQEIDLFINIDQMFGMNNEKRESILFQLAQTLSAIGTRVRKLYELGCDSVNISAALGNRINVVQKSFVYVKALTSVSPEYRAYIDEIEQLLSSKWSMSCWECNMPNSNVLFDNTFTALMQNIVPLVQCVEEMNSIICSINERITYAEEKLSPEQYSSFSTDQCSLLSRSISLIKEKQQELIARIKKFKVYYEAMNYHEDIVNVLNNLLEQYGRNLCVKIQMQKRMDIISRMMPSSQQPMNHQNRQQVLPSYISQGISSAQNRSAVSCSAQTGGNPCHALQQKQETHLSQCNIAQIPFTSEQSKRYLADVEELCYRGGLLKNMLHCRRSNDNCVLTPQEMSEMKAVQKEVELIIRVFEKRKHNLLPEELEKLEPRMKELKDYFAEIEQYIGISSWLQQYEKSNNALHIQQQFDEGPSPSYSPSYIPK